MKISRFYTKAKETKRAEDIYLMFIMPKVGISKSRRNGGRIVEIFLLSRRSRQFNCRPASPITGSGFGKKSLIIPQILT